jgi:hypothetical protein
MANALQQGIREAEETGQTWDVLQNEFRPRVKRAAPKVGDMAGQIYKQRVDPLLRGGGTGVNLKQLWVGLDSATKSRFGGTFQSWLEAYNNGEFDGERHNYAYDPTTGTVSDYGAVR